MKNIIDFISDLTFEEIPEAALSSARTCLTDTVGCMLAGIQYPPIQELARTICDRHPGPSGVAGTGLTTTPAWSAFIHTHGATYFDLDDGHRKAQGHPGGVIIPLALMTAAEHKTTGKDLLTAIVAGYETAVRSALIMRRTGGPRKGSGAWSITGAVAAAAKLKGLSKPVLKNALGLAEYYAPQAPQDRSLAKPSSMKEGMAWAAYTARTIVELATLGFDAMDPFLLDAPECVDLNENWEINFVYRKAYACCRFSHPVLDGLSALMKEYSIDQDTIESIRIKSFEKALLLNQTRPVNPVAAMYSIPYAVGCKLAKGKVESSEMGTPMLTDPQILKLADKVIIEEDPEITAVFPEKCLARVEIRLTDGTRIQSRTLSAKGDPDCPYSDNDLHKKFVGLAKPITGSETERVYSQLTHADTVSMNKLWKGLVSLSLPTVDKKIIG